MRLAQPDGLAQRHAPGKEMQRAQRNVFKRLAEGFVVTDAAPVRDAAEPIEEIRGEVTVGRLQVAAVERTIAHQFRAAGGQDGNRVETDSTDVTVGVED